MRPYQYSVEQRDAIERRFRAMAAASPAPSRPAPSAPAPAVAPAALARQQAFDAAHERLMTACSDATANQFTPETFFRAVTKHGGVDGARWALGLMTPAESTAYREQLQEAGRIA